MSSPTAMRLIEADSTGIAPTYAQRSPEQGAPSKQITKDHVSRFQSYGLLGSDKSFGSQEGTTLEGPGGS